LLHCVCVCVCVCTLNSTCFIWKLNFDPTQHKCVIADHSPIHVLPEFRSPWDPEMFNCATSVCDWRTIITISMHAYIVYYPSSFCGDIVSRSSQINVFNFYKSFGLICCIYWMQFENQATLFLEHFTTFLPYIQTVFFWYFRLPDAAVWRRVYLLNCKFKLISGRYLSENLFTGKQLNVSCFKRTIDWIVEVLNGEF
jgi:hypothetical protein